MAPHLLLHPVRHVRKASARVPEPEVVHPAAQNRIDLRDHPPHGLGVIASEQLRELPQQRRPLCELGRVPRPPGSPHGAAAPEVEAQESKRLPSPRSTSRLLASFSRRSSLASSSRSRRSTACSNHACRRYPSTRITRSSA